MTIALEDAGVRELRYSDGSLCMLLGARCGRCMELIYGSAARSFHGASRCVLKPACFVVVPHKRDRAAAVANAMMYGRHSRADAEAIVKTESEMAAMKGSV